MKRLVWLVVAVVVVAAVVAAVRVGQKPAEAKECTLPVDEKLVAAHNSFGFSMLKQLTGIDKGKNVFISPSSIALALSMTYNGAGGSTKDAMATALGFQGQSLYRINRASSALLANMEGPGPGVELRVANSLWARDGVEFKQDFMDRNRQFFNAEITTLDFADSGTPGRINGWIEDKTENRITDLIKDIDPAAILFLVNAVYFKGEWEDKFDPSSTRDSDFTLTDGTKTRVQMMNRDDKFFYYRGEGFRAGQFPYGMGRLSMIILLPDTPSSLPKLISTLDAKLWMEVTEHLSEEEGPVALPKFKLEYEAGEQMEQALTAMGMGVAFDQVKADFGNMYEKSSLPNVFINRVIHKTFLEVNEQGTEAAAATAVQTEAACAPPMDMDPPELICDHPFLCAIVDSKTNAILFIGAIMDPR